MYFRVNHTISDPAAFWSRAQESLPNLPAGIKIHNVFPNETMNLATCVWEAETEAQLREYLERKTGDVSNNDYMPINAANAMGLPT
jgi:hypothetical protein